MHRSTTAITATEITWMGYFYKYTWSDLLIDLCILWHACHELFWIFGDFYASETQDAEVTKSLHNYFKFNFPHPLLGFENEVNTWQTFSSRERKQTSASTRKSKRFTNIHVNNVMSLFSFLHNIVAKLVVFKAVSWKFRQVKVDKLIDQRTIICRHNLGLRAGKFSFPEHLKPAVTCCS